LITLVPLAFGWQAFVVQSDSMTPRIRVGDVVLASPVSDAALTLGRITVFDDPDFPGKVKTHRVIRVLPDGQLVTKGDANPTADSQRVTLDQVQGLGRLLVRYAGLPVVWLHTGQWLPLLAFLLSIVLAVWAVTRDHENDDPQWLPEDGAGPDGAAGADGALGPGWRGGSSGVLPLARVAWRQFVGRLLRRTILIVGLVTLLTLPLAFGAFAATTNNGTQSWSVPNWSYTTELVKLGPKIYYKLDDAGPTNATDSSGNGFTGTYNGGATNFGFRTTGALVTDTPNVAVDTKSSQNSCVFSPAAAAEPAPGPVTYSEIVWFKVANGYNLGGKLVGMENQRTTTVSTQYDRHVYLDGNGRVFFGVWLTASGTPKTINTPGTYNDGSWHMVATTMGPAGMRLYVDGALAASDANTISETFGGSGYWRFGCGNLAGWGGAANWTGPNAPGASRNYALQGSLDEAAVFLKQLTASDIAFLYWIR
jgi:signal peptidase I